MTAAKKFRDPITLQLGHRSYSLWGIDAEVVGSLLERGALDWIPHPDIQAALVQALKEPDPIERTKFAMALMSDIWAAAGCFGAYPFVEILAVLEQGQAFHPSHRDHVVHQLRVFLLGLWIWEHCPKVCAAMQAEPQWGAVNTDQFRRRWVAAALFHDLGYLFEAAPPDKDVFLGKRVVVEIERWLENPLHLWLARSEGPGLGAQRERSLARRARVQAPLLGSFPELLRDDASEAPTLAPLEPTGTAAGAYAPDRPLSRWLDLCKGLAPQGRPVFWDHGLTGAALLLQLHGHLVRTLPALSRVLDDQPTGTQDPDLAPRVAQLAAQVIEAQADARCAAAAIALHNLDPGLWTPDRIEAFAKLDLSAFAITLQALPMPFLLRLVDTLQDWERPAYDMHRPHAPLYDQDIWLQPWRGGLGLAFPIDKELAMTGHPASRFQRLIADLDRGLAPADCRALLHERPVDIAPSRPSAPPLFEQPEAVAFERALLEWTATRCEEMAFFKGMAKRSTQAVRLDDVYVPLEGQIAIAPGSRAGRGRSSKAAEDPRLMLGEVELTGFAWPSDGRERDAPRMMSLDELIGVPELRCWALLGAPGAGKTTLLRHAALRLAQRLLRQGGGAEYCAQLDAPPLPMFLPLRDLWRWMLAQRVQAEDLEPAHLVDWMAEVLAARVAPIELPAGYLDLALREGRLWLLLDALDEVPGEENRAEVARVIKTVAGQWARTRLLLTARTVEYSGRSVQSLAPRLPTVTVAPLSKELQRAFCRRWTQVRVGEGNVTARQLTAEQYLVELLGAIGDSRLDEPGLVDNPLLLTAVAVVYDDSGQLPEARAQLYERCCEVLVGLRPWVDQDLGWPVLFPEDPDPVEKLGPLMLVARAMQEAHLEELPTSKLEELLAKLPRFAPVESDRERRAMAERLRDLVETRSGLLVSDPAGGKVRFVHRTFQEYLCARALAEQDVGPAQMVDELGLDRLDRWWRQALVFVPGCYSIERGAAFVGALTDRAAARAGEEQAALYALAAECLAELPPLVSAHPALVDRLEPVLGTQIVQAGWPLAMRAEMGDALGRMGRPRVSGMTFLQIPGGSFLMGAQKKEPKGRNYDKEAWDDEFPVHRVSLPQFAIARFPVTVHRYAPFVTGGYDQRSCWSDEGWAWREEQGVVAPDGWQPQRRFLDRPVVGVSWYEAQAFAAWFTAKRQDGYSYDLPGEAQWERAARGPAGGRRFPWGDQLREGEEAEANFVGAGLERLSSVGLFPGGRSEEGVEELAGNIWEWSGDLLRRYSDGAPFEDKEFAGLSAANAATVRVLRGGSWHDSARYCRVSYRHAARPSGRFGVVGFRLVRSGPA